MEESPIDNLCQVVEMAVEALRGLHLLRHDDVPCFMFGHEFGALVAFEICRSVEEEFPMKALFVSSMSCPQVGVLSRINVFSIIERVVQEPLRSKICRFSRPEAMSGYCAV